jgi:Na+-transporting methylmalonyl-CoA/oxaloacetate decarboxylase gamma subunit
MARCSQRASGTLILIVLIFSRAGIGDLESRVFRLRSSVEEVKKASEAQTQEVRELRKAVEEQRKDAGDKNR